jgi:predicted AlkP superfamily phosphohydrolase/phosphomutase
VEALPDEGGRSLATRTYRPEELYVETRGVAPDLLVEFDGLRRRALGRVGVPVHVRDNDTGPDDANHAREGLYLLAAPGVSAGRGEDRDLVDVAPTVLSLLGEPIPGELEGLPLA